MVNGNKSITNADIYDRLERLRLEISKRIDDTSREHKSELTDLRRQFETLEAGRLTRAEGNINEIRLAVQRLTDSDKSTKNTFFAMETIRNIIISGAVSAFFYWLLVVHK